MKAKLISIWNWMEILTVIGVWTILISVLYVVTVPFDELRYHVGRWFRRGGHLMVLLNPLWRVRLSGFQVSRSAGPFVVVANHQSIADIPVLSHLPWEMKWLSKSSNFKLPGFGAMMKMVGDVPLERGNKEAAAVAMDRCRWYLDRGMPVMIFPEGTRSPDGRIRQFKDGAFRLAIESGIRILPVVVTGTHHCIPKKSWIFGERARIRVHVMSPVETTGLEPEDVGRLRDQVRERMVSCFEALDEPQKAGTREVAIRRPKLGVELEKEVLPSL